MASINFSFVGTHSREKHAAESVQFGTPKALFGSFGRRLSLPDDLKSFGSAIRKMQSFSLECEQRWCVQRQA
jgi:hypothetical protein